jgi:hypothetical protein
MFKIQIVKQAKPYNLNSQEKILNFLKSLIIILKIRPRTQFNYGSSGSGFGFATLISKGIFCFKKEKETKKLTDIFYDYHFK